MGLFKSKAEREKLKIKKELERKISSIQGGGRSRQSTKRRLQRQIDNLDKPKKEEKQGPRVGGAQANKRKNYGNNQTSTKGRGGRGKTTTQSKSTATMTGRERAQQMARDRIAAKKAGTYKKPKTAQELAKERLEKKNKSTKKRGRVR